MEDNRHYWVTTAKAQKDSVISVDPKKDISFGINQVSAVLASNRIKDLSSGLYSNIKHVARGEV